MLFLFDKSSLRFPKNCLNKKTSTKKLISSKKKSRKTRVSLISILFLLIKISRFASGNLRNNLFLKHQVVLLIMVRFRFALSRSNFKNVFKKTDLKKQFPEKNLSRK